MIELIPVLEISTYHNDIKMPKDSPFWKFPNEWENYNKLSNTLSGFSEDLKAYKAGFSFYEFDNVSDIDLVKIINIEIEDCNHEERIELKDCVMPFSGGYILKINNEDVLFPQCCCNLLSFNDWKGLLDSDDYIYFYCGHPSQNVSVNSDEITFDFINTKTQEKFSPPNSHKKIVLSKKQLQPIIENVESKIIKFSERLKKINVDYDLNISDIDKIFVLGFD